MLKGKWWEMFNEPELNALEEQLNINNQNIAQYFQNFMAARAQVREARASYFPTVTANPAFTSTGTGGSSAGNVAAGAGGATAPDQRRRHYSDFPCRLMCPGSRICGAASATRSARYQYAAQVSAADLENERLTEQADLAEYYFELRGQDALQDLYNRTIEADRQVAGTYARAG